MGTGAIIALLLKNLPTFIRWGDELHASWTAWRTRVAAEAAAKRADAVQARSDANSAFIESERLRVAAKAASERADSPPKAP